MLDRFLLKFFITYIIHNMTPEKIKEIEQDIKFKLWLRRVGFKSFNEYEFFTQNGYINKTEVILYYIQMKWEKDNKFEKFIAELPDIEQ